MACQHLTQVLGSHWLAQKTIHTGFCGKLAVSGRCVGRQGNNRQLLRASNMFDTSGSLETIDVRHAQIHEHQIKGSGIFGNQLVGLHTGTRHRDIEPHRLKNPGVQQPVNFIVFHQQHTTIEQHRAINGQTCSTFHLGIGWRVIRETLKLKIVPSPTADCTCTLPPNASTKRCTMLNPRPVPCCFRVSAVMPVANGWNSFGSASSGTPGPGRQLKTLGCQPAPLWQQTSGNTCAQCNGP